MDMVRIAMVEDNEIYCSQLEEYIRRHEKESGESFRISVFTDGGEIAVAVGYENVSYFHRKFADSYRKSPKHYRDYGIKTPPYIAVSLS